MILVYIRDCKSNTISCVLAYVKVCMVSLSASAMVVAKYIFSIIIRRKKSQFLNYI